MDSSPVGNINESNNNKIIAILRKYLKYKEFAFTQKLQEFDNLQKVVLIIIPGITKKIELRKAIQKFGILKKDISLSLFIKLN